LPTSIRIRPELKAALADEADKRRQPVAKLIRHILEDWVKWARRQDVPMERKRR